ncbi:MAG: hypothetical protein WBK55_03740 [Alphaproteobacteria bacterium]
MSDQIGITGQNFIISDEMRKAAEAATPGVPEFQIAPEQEQKPAVRTTYEPPELPVAIIHS